MDVNHAALNEYILYTTNRLIHVLSTHYMGDLSLERSNGVHTKLVKIGVEFQSARIANGENCRSQHTASFSIN